MASDYVSVAYEHQALVDICAMLSMELLHSRIARVRARHIAMPIGMPIDTHIDMLSDTQAAIDSKRH